MTTTRFDTANRYMFTSRGSNKDIEIRANTDDTLFINNFYNQTIKSLAYTDYTGQNEIDPNSDSVLIHTDLDAINQGSELAYGYSDDKNWLAVLCPSNDEGGTMYSVAVFSSSLGAIYTENPTLLINSTFTNSPPRRMDMNETGDTICYTDAGATPYLYVHRRSGTTWTQEVTYASHYPIACKISGSTIVIPTLDNGLYVLEYLTASTFTTITLTPDEGIPGSTDYLVDISGSIIAHHVLGDAAINIYTKVGSFWIKTQVIPDVTLTGLKLLLEGTLIASDPTNLYIWYQVDGIFELFQTIELSGTLIDYSMTNLRLFMLFSGYIEIWNYRGGQFVKSGNTTPITTTSACIQVLGSERIALGQPTIGDGQTTVYFVYDYTNEVLGGSANQIILGNKNLKLISDYGKITMDPNVQIYGSLDLDSGEAAIPSLTFGNTDTGLYSGASGQLNISIQGTNKYKINSAAMSFPDGGMSAPGINFGTSTTGVYGDSGTVNIAVTGTKTAEFNKDGLVLKTGSASKPAVMFGTDTSSGIYQTAANTLEIGINGTKRITIGSPGAGAASVHIGGSSTNVVPAAGGAALGIYAPNPRNNICCMQDGTAAHAALSFYNNFAVTPTLVGSIYTSGSTTTYATSSSVAKKENIVPMDNTDTINKIKALEPKRYNFKSTGEASFGLIAEDCKMIVPEAVVVMQVIDGIEELGIDYGKFTPMLIQTTKDLLARIELLEAKVAVLESS